MQSKRFEEMNVWQDARSLTSEIYGATARAPFSRDFGLRDQIQRSAVSVMSNISEGYERGSRREFVVYLHYAKGSVGELRSQLCGALDLEYIRRRIAPSHRSCVVNIEATLPVH